MKISGKTIAGIKIPDSAMAGQATELLCEHGSELLYNHTLRVFLFAALNGQQNKLRYDAELLYEINSDLYNKYAAKYHEERREIEGLLLKAAGRVSNLQKSIDTALCLASKVAFKWRTGSYYTKQRIQFLLFPSGINYNKKNDGCRTERINFVFLYLAYLQQIMSNKKSGIPELNLDFAAFAGLVAGSRIELPTLGL
jgi:hypothetical protein